MILRLLNSSFWSQFLKYINALICSANPCWFVGTCKYVNTLMKETMQIISSICFETQCMHMATAEELANKCISLYSVRSGGGVVDNTLDYQSRGREIDPPLLRSFG